MHDKNTSAATCGDYSLHEKTHSQPPAAGPIGVFERWYAVAEPRTPSERRRVKEKKKEEEGIRGRLSI